MGFNCGIVGLPNVGKSTIFNSITAAKAEAANYPFCTIDPNKGIVKVPDKRIREIARLIKSEKEIPATMEFVDIAGLVRGANKGEGLGNQFLGHIREVQAIAHVVRCFEDGDITHVEGSVDPIRDIETIETELQLADLSSIEKKHSSVTKLAKSGDKEAGALLGVLDPIKKCLEEGGNVRSLSFSDSEWELTQTLHLLTSKKVLYVCNISEEDIGKPIQEIPLVVQVLERVEQEGAKCVVFCGKIESEISQMDSAEEKEEFLKDLGIEESGLDQMIRTGYQILDLITYFTAGPKEVRAWTIKKGTLAPQAAGVIHTDFEKGFIKAEVYHYEDLLVSGSEAKIKEKGLLRIEGKDYEVLDGDIVHFRFNV